MFQTYEFLSSVEQDILKNVSNQTVDLLT